MVWSDGTVLLEAHQYVVSQERNGKAHEPRVVVQSPHGRNRQACQRGSGSERKSSDCPPIESTRIFVQSSAQIQILYLKYPAPNDEVIADHDAGHRAQKCGIATKPSQDERAVIRKQFPRHHRDTHEAGDDASSTEA